MVLGEGTKVFEVGVVGCKGPAGENENSEEFEFGLGFSSGFDEEGMEEKGFEFPIAFEAWFESSSLPSARSSTSLFISADGTLVSA